MCLYGEIIPSYSEGIINCTGRQTMLFLSCTMISSVDFAHYRVSHAKIRYLWIVVQERIIVNSKFEVYTYYGTLKVR